MRNVIDAFFVVWCPAGGSPTVRHHSFNDAKDEAERLASLNPGHEFHVLYSVGTAKRVDVGWTYHSAPPF